jgi:tRNA pseudouridine38-40 synthase
VLEDALFAAGAILPTNYQSAGLGRLSWTRSSRTDKGVSSLATWVSCRLEVDDAWWDNCGGGAELLRLLEAQLPPTVRVFDAQLVPRRFSARVSCTTRTYHYYLPLRTLTLPEPFAADGELLAARLAALSAALRRFEGTHPFHNFTKRSLYRPPPQNGGRNTDADADVEEYADAEGEAKDEAPLLPSAVSSDRVVGSFERQCFWYTRPPASRDPDVVGNQHFRRVLYANCSAAMETVGGQPCVRLTLVGESFLLHQIRKMVATALAVARGLLPADFVGAALCRPARTRVPMAPASTLLLADAAFRPFRPDTSGGAPDPSVPPRLLQAGEAVQARMDAWAAEKLLPTLSAALADASWDEFVLDNLAAMCPEAADLEVLLEEAAAYKLARKEHEGQPWDKIRL